MGGGTGARRLATDKGRARGFDYATSALPRSPLRRRRRDTRACQSPNARQVGASIHYYAARTEDVTTGRACVSITTARGRRGSHAALLRVPPDPAGGVADDSPSCAVVARFPALTIALSLSSCTTATQTSRLESV